MQRLWESKLWEQALHRLPLLLVAVLAAACASVDTTGNQTVFRFNNPFDNIGLAPSTLRIIYLVGGLILLVAGWRIADWIVAIAGFVIGAGIGMSLVDNSNEVLTLIALVAGGLLGVVLALGLQYVAIFIAGAYLGALLAVQLWTALSTTPAPVWVIIVGGVVGGLILVGLSFQFIVVLSAAVGATLLGMALGLDTIWIFVLFIVGLIVQVVLARASRYPIVVRRRRTRRVFRRSDL